MAKGIFEKQLRGKPHSIAVVGAGAAGSMVATLLSCLGFDVTVLESEDSAFDSRSASQNNTGIIHHLIYGGDPAVQSHLFKAGLLFSEFFPEHIMADKRMLYLAPPTVQHGKRNTALEGSTNAQGQDVSLATNFDALKRDYAAYCQRPGAKPHYGTPGALGHEVSEREMRALLGTPPEAAGWLSGAPVGHHFATGVAVNQLVVNTAALARHMQDVMDQLHADKGEGFQLLTQHHVEQIKASPDRAGFDISLKGTASVMHFDTVVNAGYAEGLEVRTDAPKAPVHLKQKAFGLFKVPPDLLDKFQTSLFMVRSSELGGIVRMGPGLVALVSGRNYNRDDIGFSECQHERALPAGWKGSVDEATAHAKNPSATHSEAELLDKIQKDLAQWFPAVRGLEPVKLYFGPHLYPPERATADELVSASRSDSFIHEEVKNPLGGQSFLFFAAKLTSVPFGAVQCVRHILEPYIQQGVLTREQVGAQLHIDQDGYAVVSEGLKRCMGCDRPKPAQMLDE